MDDPGRRDDELSCLRRQVVLARFYLERFADPKSFVWGAGDRTPHQLAREALKEMDAQGHWPDAAGEFEEGGFAIGTGRMTRLSGGRAGFVEFHQLLARQALDIGRVGAARAALWVLRSSDFSASPEIAEVLLGVMRDNSASDEQIAEAALRLTRLPPSPGVDRPK
jgi:hypothetical protein